MQSRREESPEKTKCHNNDFSLNSSVISERLLKFKEDSNVVFGNVQKCLFFLYSRQSDLTEKGFRFLTDLKGTQHR